MWGLSSGVGLTIQSFVGDGLEVAVAVFVGLDVHRAQITFDALDVESGEVHTGRVQPANRETFRRFLARFHSQPLVAAVEAMTGWRFIVEELARVGAEVHLAEPADTSAKRGPKRRAKTDRLDARVMRELLMDHRLPEAWIAPAHILDLRARVRLRKTLVDQRTEWLQRIHAVLFHHGVPTQAGRLGRLEGEHAREQLAGLHLPRAAEQQIAVALAIIEQLNALLHPLELELERDARRLARLPRADGPLRHRRHGRDRDPRRARRPAALLLLTPGSPLRRARHHRARVRRAPSRRAPLAPGLARAALGAVRGGADRRASGLARSRLLPRAQGPTRRQPRRA